MIALIDESIRPPSKRGHKDRHLYVLAATLVHVGREAEIRRLITDRVGPKRFHFVDDSVYRRRALLGMVNEARLPSYVAWRWFAAAKEQEPTRARVLATLLRRLHNAGATELWFETREAHNDDADRQRVERARRKGYLVECPDTYRAPELESLLWLPDAVGGAVGIRIEAEGVGKKLRDDLVLWPILTAHAEPTLIQA